ncbi:MAG: hypothetical protein IKP73_06295 [Bacteroidales bacterium]|nr:hypothetical protein [Bacteroidales bacterium]
MDYVSDEEFKEIRNDYFNRIKKVRPAIRTMISLIDEGSVTSAQRREIQESIGIVFSEIQLLKKTRNFSKEQLEVLAHLENEVNQFDTSIAEALKRHEKVMNEPIAKIDYVKMFNLQREELLSKQYIDTNATYASLMKMINKFETIQKTADWTNMSEDRKNSINSIMNELSKKKAEVVNISADVLSKNGKIALSIASVILALLASIQGWGWICITLPLTLYYIFNMLLTRKTQKTVDIIVFAVLAAIMLSIILPIKGSLIATIPLAIFGYLFIKRNRGLIGEKGEH